MIKEREGITTKEFLPKAKKYLATISKEEFMSDLKEQADIEKHHEQASPLPVPLEDREELVKIISDGFYPEVIVIKGREGQYLKQKTCYRDIADALIKAGYKKG